jgi:hypothetical protein
MITINNKDGLVLDGTGIDLITETLVIAESVAEQLGNTTSRTKQEVLTDIINMLTTTVKKEDLLAESVEFETMPDDFGVIRKDI